MNEKVKNHQKKIQKSRKWQKTFRGEDETKHKQLGEVSYDH